MVLNLHRFAVTDTTGKLLNINESSDSIDSLAEDVDFGWTFIESGSVGAVDNFIIDFTAGGKYPLDTFHALRIYMTGEPTDISYVDVRINSDETTDAHRRGFVIWEVSDGTVLFSNETNGENLVIARWASSFATNNCICTIMIHDSHTTMQSMSFRASGVNAEAIGKFVGQSINLGYPEHALIFPNVGTFVSAKWYVEGLRIAADSV